MPTVYCYGTQDRRDVRINRGTVGVAATHLMGIESVVDQKREALKAFATQKYQGKGYSTPEAWRATTGSSAGAATPKS